MSEFVEARDDRSAVHRRWRMQDICHTGAAPGGPKAEIEKALATGEEQGL